MSIYNRAEIVHRNFLRRVGEKNFPDPRTDTDWSNSGLDKADVIELLESQFVCRHLDLAARKLKARNLGFYSIGSAGHEGNAVFGRIFRKSDMAFLHYRSGAFMAERARKSQGIDIIRDTLLSLVASSDDPIAGGRHKVWGSLPLMVPPQTSTIASHLPKAVGVALSIAKANDMKLQPSLPRDSVVLCSFGDASINHSTALGAVNAAMWTAHQNVPMPIVFLCEDNQIGLSVPTPPQWIQSQYSNRSDLFYVPVDGLDLFDLHVQGIKAEQYAREHRKPVFIHMKTVRLLGHAGSEVESVYRSLDRIQQAEGQDPLLHSARLVIENGIMKPAEVIDLYQRIERRVEEESERAVVRPKLETAAQVRSALIACRNRRTIPAIPIGEQRRRAFAADSDKLSKPQHMAKLINWGLRDVLLRYDSAVLFGEDVAQKGGVYNVTDGLYKTFGARRVFNSPLDEQSILGTAIGLAHNGFLPIPEIQFLAYIHNAEDQIRGEAATLAFFSQGQFTNPMVIRIAGLGYQKGFGGHFHNDNSLAVFRDIPGLIIAIPSNGADAVRMFRTCIRQAYENGRVCVFVEPIALYMTKDLHHTGDRGWTRNYPAPNEEAPLGTVRRHGSGHDAVILTYGNGLYYSMQAQKELGENHGVQTSVVDLMWMAPVNRSDLMAQIVDAKNILIVDECRRTGSWSEGLVAMIVDKADPLPSIRVVAADDCFIPLGLAAAAGLPGKQDIVSAVLNMI
jgi:2-oxoisovalerate dehydrogenase E1 component